MRALALAALLLTDCAQFPAPVIREGEGPRAHRVSGTYA